MTRFKYQALDYAAIRRLISLRQVLALIGYEPVRRRGPQWCGHCPICQRELCFSAHIERGCFQCFRCGRHGNQLDLWSKLSGLSLYRGTLDLCHRLNVTPVPLPNQQPHNRP